MSDVWFIYGPPGTGKTTTLARHARRAAEQHSPESVAIASLTRAAAAEIGGRDTGIPDANVGTLHAHAYRALERPELAETPEGLRAWNEAHPGHALTRGANHLEDTVAGGGGDGGTSAGDDLHHQVMANRARMLPREAWTDDQRDHDRRWSDWKTQTQRLDFTDLIEQAIADVPAHPAYPQVLLLDEAQDFSRLELALASRWAQHAITTVMVGDPLQAIYGWRGADPDALRELDLAGEKFLTQSYRVPHNVHNAARRWITQIGGEEEAGRYARYAPTAVQGHIQRQIGTSLHNAEALAMQLVMQLERGKTVMVLASCRYMLAPLIAVLRKQGVPFHNPYRAADGQWNPMRAANRLKAFLRPDERVWGEHARAWTWDDVRLFTDPLAAKGNLVRGAKALIEAKCKPDRFGESRANELVDIEVLPNIFGEALDHPAYRLDVEWYFSQLRADGRKTLTYPVQVLRQHGPGALREEPRLTLGTVHSVKGGESDVVYVAPDLSVTGYWHGWRAGGLGHDQVVRLFYVALTRAREEVVLLDPSGSENVPFDLLAEVGEEAIAA
jgi:DNA helicase-2/ATP-dependent DNA helicase PcrA